MMAVSIMETSRIMSMMLLGLRNVERSWVADSEYFWVWGGGMGVGVRIANAVSGICNRAHLHEAVCLKNFRNRSRIRRA